MAQPKPPPTAYAKSVRAARDAAGLTQIGLSVALGISASTIYRIEQGHEPSDEVRERIARWMARRPSLAA